ncbi:MAG TPA: single-stranded DNA-binding protein [Actinobacteria bacterium]|jgi:single-strand DNA-binding protein|nr:single-stranded DNA-binding protein [Actinomycetota bacterium]
MSAVAESSPTSSSVLLIGRLGATVTERELPSGDVITVFTVIVDRPRARGSRVQVDAIPCQAMRAGVRARLRRLAPGSVIEVEGSLRRRFWRSGAGLGSALEVDVDRITTA